MATSKKSTVGKPGIIFFAKNSRIPRTVKIAKVAKNQPIKAVLGRANSGQGPNTFKAGIWVSALKQRVSVDDVDSAMIAARKFFSAYKDEESPSSDMYFLPEGITEVTMAEAFENLMQGEAKAKNLMRSSQA